MLELIDKINNEEFDHLDDCKIFIQEYMLEKEKEMMCEFAFNCGDEIKDQNNWRSPRNLTNYEVILDFYNETFNTKER